MNDTFYKQSIISAIMCIAIAISTSAAVHPLRVGVQCYSYKKFSFEETISRVAKLGIKYVEMYPSQTLEGMPGKKTNPTSDAKTIEYILKTAKDKGVTIISYGVVHAPNEKGWKQVFEFAKAIGIEVILTEDLKGSKKDIIDRFSKKYNIRVALHNHQTPSPDEVLADLSSVNNPLIGSGMDIGHWTRAGYNIPAELDRVGRRILTMHIKDINIPGMGGRCVPLGTGIVPLKEILGKLLRTGYTGALIIEYEGHWDNPSPGIEKCKSWLDNYFKNAEKAEKEPNYVAADQISILYAQRNLLSKEQSIRKNTEEKDLHGKSINIGFASQVAISVPAYSKEYHISINGDDANDGSKKKTFPHDPACRQSRTARRCDHGA